MNTYTFLPLDSSILPLHIGRGIIKPSIFSDENIKDIQSRFPNYLLLSNSKWLNCDSKNDCCIEVILTSDEIKALHSYNDFALLSSCLPISRIKRIYFKDKEQMDKTIFNIEQGDGFIPNIYEYEQSESIKNIDIVTPPIPKKGIDLSKKIVLFDQILGGFACMRLAGRLSNRYQSNFSEGYFATLGQINESIKLSCEKAKISTKSRVAGIFYKNAEMKYEDKFLTILNSPPKSESDFYYDLKKYDKSEPKSELLEAINSTLGIAWELLGDDSYLIALALLSRYGTGKRKSTSDLFNDFIAEKIPFQEKLESLLFIYGFHYGYSQFRKTEKINTTMVPIKFELNSCLDYLTIESIFQYAFNNKINNLKFDYIDEWCPKYSEKSLHSDIYMLDVPIIGLPVKDSSNVLSTTIQKIVSFFLDPEKGRFSKKTLFEMEKELTAKVDNLMNEVKSVYEENSRYKKQLFEYERDKNLFKKNLADYEKELLLYQNKIKDLEQSLISKKIIEDTIAEPYHRKETTNIPNNKCSKKSKNPPIENIDENVLDEKSDESKEDQEMKTDHISVQKTKTAKIEPGDLFKDNPQDIEKETND